MPGADHFEGGDGGFLSFMAMFTTGSFGYLLFIVHRENAKNGGNGQQQVELEHPIGDGAAYIFKMRGIAAEYTTQRNKGMGFIIPVFVLIPVAFDPEGNFKRAGHHQGAMLYPVCVQHFAATGFQQAGYRFVPFGTHYNDTGILGKKDACGLK